MNFYCFFAWTLNFEFAASKLWYFVPGTFIDRFGLYFIFFQNWGLWSWLLKRIALKCFELYNEYSPNYWKISRKALSKIYFCILVLISSLQSPSEADEFGELDISSVPWMCQHLSHITFSFSKNYTDWAGCSQFSRAQYIKSITVLADVDMVQMY